MIQMTTEMIYLEGVVTEANSKHGKNHANQLFQSNKMVCNSLKSFNRFMINSIFNFHGNRVQSDIFVFMSNPTIVLQVCNKG